MPARSAPPLHVLHLSAADFPKRDRVETFRAHYAQAVGRVDIAPSPGVPFEYAVTLLVVPGFSAASGWMSPCTHAHRGAHADHDDPTLILAGHGRGRARQAGREVELAAGDATLMTNGLDTLCAVDERSHLRVLRFDRALLSALVPNLDDALVRKLPRESPVLRMLARYATLLDDPAALATPELRRTLSLHMHDLAALLLGPTRDVAEAATGGGVRAARWAAVQADIAAHLTEPGLSIDTVCARVQLSPRVLRSLFHAAGTTFAAHVNDQRLTRVHRQLRSPACDAQPITKLVFAAGFNDLSYFNRLFRRRYGLTPSEARAAAGE